MGSTSNFVILGNHSSWWDPLVAMYLAERFFPQFQHFSPIDSEALQKYKIFENFGFYGVDQTNRRGAVEFLKTSDRILTQPNTCIWITPEGKFVDVRDHAQPLEPGASHLASRTSGTSFLPLAIELCFWEEKKPELFCSFGKPISADQDLTKPEWNDVLNAGLRSTQIKLAEQVISRDDRHFEIMIGGHAGVNWAYDSLRRIGSFFTGSKIDVAHGKKLEAKTLISNNKRPSDSDGQSLEARN